MGFSAKERGCAIKERDVGDEGRLRRHGKKQTSGGVCSKISKNERECNHRHWSIASQRTPRLLSLEYK